MDYVVYVLYSPRFDKIYIGQTSNLEQRLKEHRRGYSKATSYATDWKVVYSEKYGSRSEAYKRERQLKTGGGRSFIWDLIKGE